MRELGDEQVSRDFTGSLLVAHPNMVDPNFRRTVLFVSEHEPNEGALGVIINAVVDALADLGVARMVADATAASGAGTVRICFISAGASRLRPSTVPSPSWKLRNVARSAAVVQRPPAAIIGMSVVRFVLRDRR